MEALRIPDCYARSSKGVKCKGNKYGQEAALGSLSALSL